MSYTTGEMAKLAAVSVRTIQYYDQRGILDPTDLTQGEADADFIKRQTWISLS